MLSFIDLCTGYEIIGCASSVLCLGNFDGVHLGHAELIRRTVRRRAELSGTVPGILGGAWCFRQPPADFLFNGQKEHLTTVDEKLELFRAQGLDIAILGEFSELCDLSPADFVNKVLIDECSCVCAVCGFNFRFGKNGAGTTDDLTGFSGGAAGIVEPVTYKGMTVSSSAVRRFLLDGDAEAAAGMLGRQYSLTSEVLHGKALGRRLGVPTLNQRFPEGKLVPAFGVYATKVRVCGKEYISVSNVGTNPTVGDKYISCETHIPGFDGDLYRKTVTVSFFRRLRDECRFPDTDALVSAVHKDIDDAENYFSLN